MAYPNPKMRRIFGSQNQTGRIVSTTLTMKPEFTIYRLFFNQVLAKYIQRRRSLDDVHTRHEFGAPEHLTAHADGGL